MPKDELSGRTALVTGASGGLGADFARVLASMGCHLVLVARQEQALEALKTELEPSGVKVRVLPMDLTSEGAAQKLEAELANTEVDVLINNAGFGMYGSFHELDWERQRNMLELNIVALTELSHRFARHMVERRQGWILQVASIGAYQSLPLYGVYAATKAYVLSLGEAMHFELAPHAEHGAVRRAAIRHRELARRATEVRAQRGGHRTVQAGAGVGASNL